jgi:UDP-glucose 4-epimerase
LNWIITGGGGFVGANLASELVKEKTNRIRVIDNFKTRSPNVISKLLNVLPSAFDNEKLSWKKHQIIECDILEQDKITTLIEGADVVVHLAANTGVPKSIENPLFDSQTNVIGTLNLLESARKHKIAKFINASSGAVIGNKEQPGSETSLPSPISPYGASKLATEHLCSSYFHTYGLETISLRFSNIFGPSSQHKTSIVSNMLNSAFYSKEVTIYGDGEQTRDFLFVSDLVSAIVSASKSQNIGGEKFHIASGKETKVNTIKDLIISLLSSHYNLDITEVYKEPRIGDVRRSFFKIEKAKTHLCWKPETSLEDGLILTLSKYKEQ